LTCVPANAIDCGEKFAWRLRMLDSVIDVSHYQGANLDFAAAAQNGITAVIHKATQGTHSVDPLYVTNRSKARAANLLFGSYHFGTGEDGGEQAAFYLQTVGPQTGELLTLDFEGNNGGPSMALEEARAFVTFIHDRIGKWPLLYTGHYLKDLIGSHPDPVLSNCPLWLAQYGPTPVLPAGFAAWRLWQWTNGVVGVNPQPVAGVGHCDRDRFNDGSGGLAAFWSSVSADMPLVA
jgi:lysozyme